MSNTIRAATRDDLDAILRIMRVWVDEDITWGQQVTAKDYLESRIGRYFLVSERSSKIVGYVFGDVVASPLAVFQDGLYLNIEEIYVIPTERGCGIGCASILHLQLDQGSGSYYHILRAPRF